MYHWIPFWPDVAAENAVAVNALYVAELGVAGLIMATVLGMMLTFCFRYRRGTTASRAGLIEKTWHVEIVGKQWMWKVEHPGGQREIDALHVPVDKAIRVVMASEDVIHSFFVPEFRVKRDVVPGTLQTLWFKPNKTGIFRLECTQFCGLQHATMTGEIVVMTAAEYAQWLTEQGVHESLAEQGEALFLAHGCSGCHVGNSTVHAPSLVGLYGTLVHLQDGSVRFADEAYIRDCIVNPRSFTVAGYPPVMPDYAGQLGEDDLLKLIAYIKSLGRARESGR
jgi:cytochrome c oxidase subunit II